MFLHKGPGNLTFFVDPAYEPLWPCPALETRIYIQLPCCVNLLDHGLVHLANVLKRFCDEVNTASNMGTKLSETLYLNAMVTIMYRLALAAYDVDSVDEAFRLGLLAFVSI